MPSLRIEILNRILSEALRELSFFAPPTAEPKLRESDEGNETV
jgi:hypothetical protein